MISGRRPVSRSMVSTVLRHTSKRTPCAIRLSTCLRAGLSLRKQLDAGAERDHFDGDLVRIVEFQQIVGDADHEVLLADVVVGELQHDLVLRKRLVLQRHLLRPAARQRCGKQPPRQREREAISRCSSRNSSSDSRIAVDALQGDVTLTRARKLAGSQIAREHLPHRLARLRIDRGPARHLVTPVRLERSAVVELQFGDALADAFRRTAGVGQAADAHHVAALLVVGIGVEQIVADVFQHVLDLARRSCSAHRSRDR